MANSSREGCCGEDGCAKPIFAKRMCKAHYQRWYRREHPEKFESYNAARRSGPSLADRRAAASRQSKLCEQCGSTIQRTTRASQRQWECKRFCSARCANTWRAQQQAGFEAWGVGDTSRARNNYRRNLRRSSAAWAEWWEQVRRSEDLADWDAMKVPIGPCRRLTDRPKIRRFIGWYCASCAEPFVYYAKRAQSPYCAECNEAHHRRPANRRARQNGALYEVIVPHRVFERDGWRCQICGRKTRGNFPSPTSATVDHIVPLAVGGDHLYINVQCACFECNWRKADGAANDQLRLIP